MKEETKSAFDPKMQTQHLSSKIMVALERIAEAFKVSLWEESKKHQLSPIQIQILIFLQFHPPDKCKVSYLAQEFNITKATVSDAVKILLAKELIYKEIETDDSRSYKMYLSEQGQKIAKSCAGLSDNLENAILQIPDNQKVILFDGLFQIIAYLNQNGMVNVQRMCLNCRFYQLTVGQHFCNFLNTPLKINELRIDCEEHQPK